MASEEWTDNTTCRIVKKFSNDVFVEENDELGGYLVCVEGHGFGVYSDLEQAIKVAKETFDEAQRLGVSPYDVWEKAYVEEVKQIIAENARKACSKFIGQDEQDKEKSS